MAASVDIAGIIDGQKVGSFHVVVVGVSFLLMLADGYDNISIAYIAPLLLREWSIDKPALVFMAGFCLIALQFGIIATESQVYPTCIRSWGVGSCFAFGRVGSVLGPLAGGAMLAGNMPVQNLFTIASALLLIGLAVAVALTPLYRIRIREMVQGASRAG
jgi:hypothetical protein